MKVTVPKSRTSRYAEVSREIDKRAINARKRKSASAMIINFNIK